ncbi:MAG: hypothetical protein ABIP51_11675 [Bacteroidia bacterium]
MIDLKVLLAKHILLQSEGEGPISHNEAAINAMKEIWNLCVNECKKASKFKIRNGDKSGVFDLYQKNDFIITKDEDSIEKVKQMIK